MSFFRMLMIRSKALMQGAKDQPCVICGAQDGTVVRAHYCGMYQHIFGKGIGQKVHDLIAAYLCRRCHERMDQYKDGSNLEREIEFLVACLLTIIVDVMEGRITIRGFKP